jgi:hypothetical protein
MSQPCRLLDDPNATSLERLLLRAWGDERPTPAARERTLVALGVGGAVAAGASTASAAGGAASSITLFKWLVGTIAIGTVVTAGVASRDRVEKGEATNKPPMHAEATAFVPATAVVDLVTVAESAKSGTRLPKPAPPASLSDEIAAMDGARVVLASDPKAALDRIESYELRFPKGAFVEEAEVLRIEALLATNEAGEAIRVADRFLAAHATSPHAPRVRALTKR